MEKGVQISNGQLDIPNMNSQKSESNPEAKLTKSHLFLERETWLYKALFLGGTVEPGEPGLFHQGKKLVKFELNQVH